MKACRIMSVMVMVVIVALSLTSNAYADQGTATFYMPPYVRTRDELRTASACNGFQNDGVMIAAASDAFWDNGAACGSKYQVACTGATNNGVSDPCTGQSIVVTIVDYCPSGCQGTIDLSQEAFAIIADPNAGKIYVQFDMQ